MSKLLKHAKTITKLIEHTEIEDRGILLSHIATILRSNDQHYTAALFYKAAVEYGLPPNKEIDSSTESGNNG